MGIAKGRRRKIGNRKVGNMAANVALVVLAIVVAALVAFAMKPVTPPSSPTLPIAQTSPTATARARLPMVFMGDSITRGDTAGFNQRPSSLSWARYVTEAGLSPWSFLSIPAVNGEQTGAMVARFDKDVTSLKPGGVAILAGTNDILHVARSESMGNLSAMIAKAKRAKIKVFLLTIPPSDQNPDMIAPFNAALRALASSEGVPLLNIYPDLAAGDGHWKPGLTTDGTHPSVKGAKLIAGQVLRQLSAGSGH